MNESKKKPHFVLVHGACHGAWCWYRVVTQLRSEGHRVTALDMAASGTDPKRPEEVGSTSDYFQPLMEFMGALPPEERVVLVGHSMGGICISAGMERFPSKIAVAIFVTAYMPGPDFPLSVVFQEVNQIYTPYIFIIVKLFY